MREEYTPRADTEMALDSRYERVDLPSCCVFYPWTDVSIRRVEPIDHAKVARASRTKNLSTMIDAMGSLITRDPRDFCLPDFFAICHWQKAHGYPANTSTVEWTSYGERVTKRIQRTRLVTKLLDVSAAEMEEWRGKGMSIPTVRDLETFDTLDDPDIAIAFERAQYIDPAPLADRVAVLRQARDPVPSVTARIEALQARGMSFYAEVDAFADRFGTFSVDEVAEVTHPHWDVKRALQYLKGLNTPEACEEIRTIETTLAEGGAPQPRKEVIPLSFDLWTMFPWT